MDPNNALSSCEPPVLYMVSPCFNEEEVLPLSSKLFRKHLTSLIEAGAVSPDSKILFVDDGSSDRTWDIIESLASNDAYYEGISLSRNRGHQNALLAGLMESRDRCDICISLDCDGQHDPKVMADMIDQFNEGCDIVYAVRTSRDTDGFFKKVTSQGFYGFMNAMGVEIRKNAADYRLMSSRALEALSEFKEVNLFLRGMVPLVGYKSAVVEYECAERMAGESHYPFKKMLSLAGNGITSLSVKPLHFITIAGFVITFISIVGITYAIVMGITGHTVQGWTSLLCAICLVGGVQMLSMGIIGEYIGKIYMETKNRPRYIVDKNTLLDN